VKSIFQIGDKKIYRHLVGAEDTAAFAMGQVHPVYATFALGRDAEWCSRQFVLEMKEADEEGIGTFVSIKHIAPALVGSEVVFEATIDELRENEINCSFTAKTGNRPIAEGRTGQKILKREKLEKLFAQL